MDQQHTRQGGLPGAAQQHSPLPAYATHCSLEYGRHAWLEWDECCSCFDGVAQKEGAICRLNQSLPLKGAHATYSKLMVLC